jgi:DNA polymerase I
VMERLMGPESENRFHACDTEVMDLDLKSVGPVGNGYVTCASVYSGEDFDYGLGDGPGTVLWIDNLDDACGVLQEFKAWFEDERFKKIWHNYGFDRHVMWNEGIDCRGFGGDTMHMARLEDSSRSREGNGNGYSLEALTEELVGRRKRPMKEIFGIKRLRKDGSEGSIIDLPPVEVMQRDPVYRSKWIEYGCYDAQGTFLIHKELRKRLCRIPWLSDGDGQVTNNLYEYYWQHMRPFGEVLTDMERRG